MNGYIIYDGNRPVRAVKVHLSVNDVVKETTTTDAFGQYIFSGVRTESCRVQIELPIIGRMKMECATHPTSSSLGVSRTCIRRDEEREWSHCDEICGPGRYVFVPFIPIHFGPFRSQYTTTSTWGYGQQHPRSWCVCTCVIPSPMLTFLRSAGRTGTVCTLGRGVPHLY